MKTLSRALFKLNIRQFLAGSRSRMPVCDCGMPAALEAPGPGVTGTPNGEQLERIAALARSGYFHLEYPPGTFVVPIEMPPH